jgi:hypothetical protein
MPPQLYTTPPGSSPIETLLRGGRERIRFNLYSQALEQKQQQLDQQETDKRVEHNFNVLNILLKSKVDPKAIQHVWGKIADDFDEQDVPGYENPLRKVDFSNLNAFATQAAKVYQNYQKEAEKGNPDQARNNAMEAFKALSLGFPEKAEDIQKSIDVLRGHTFKQGLSLYQQQQEQEKPISLPGTSRLVDPTGKVLTPAVKKEKPEEPASVTAAKIAAKSREKIAQAKMKAAETKLSQVKGDPKKRQIELYRLAVDIAKQKWETSEENDFGVVLDETLRDLSTRTGISYKPLSRTSPEEQLSRSRGGQTKQTYKTPEEVKAAVQAKTISQKEAIQILRTQFGFD